MMSSTADVYYNEIPGGQYTNLYQQAAAVGLASKWPQICKAYAECNQLVGDIVKVTPSSKAIGDMALFLVSNNLTTKEVMEGQRELAFPASVIDLLSGKMGQPPGGFPPEVQKRILRGEKPITVRPGELMPMVDCAAVRNELEGKIGRTPTALEVQSYLMYPKVFLDFVKSQEEFADLSILPTNVFFYGMEPGQEITVDLEPGKTLIIKYLTTGDPHQDGHRTVFFELNGQPRSIDVFDKSLDGEVKSRAKATPGDTAQVGAPMPGAVTTVTIKQGDVVSAGQKLFSLEAMKMETTIYAERDGKVAELLVSPGTQVDTGDLLLRLE
jgi:pyruvate carboxylase